MITVTITDATTVTIMGTIMGTTTTMDSGDN